MLISVYVAYLLGGYCATRWQGDAETNCLRFMWIMGGTVCASLLVYGCTLTTVQAVFLAGAYLFSSYSDIKSRMVDDSVHILVLAVALIGRQVYEIPTMAISAGFICGVMVAVAVLSKGAGIGGADIKLATASAFLLGFNRSVFGLCVGLSLGVVINFIKQKKSREAKGFPLVPYIAVGFMLAFFIK